MAKEVGNFTLRYSYLRPILTRHFYKQHSLIPEGYTFLNPNTMISKHAYKLFNEWAAQMEKCNPDFFDMYIYNGMLSLRLATAASGGKCMLLSLFSATDFAWYGQLHVVDHALRGIHSRIDRRILEETFYRLEALIFVNSYCAGWTSTWLHSILFRRKN